MKTGKQYKAANYLFALIVVVLVSSCENNIVSPTATIMPIPDSMKDISIISGEPCKPPCWYNIIPNQSTKSELLDVINSLDFLDSTTVRSRQTNYWDPTTGYSIKDGELIAVDCKEPENNQCVGIIVVDEKVKQIGVFINYDLRFQAIIERLGIPEFVRIYERSGLFQGCELRLLWVSKQFTAATTLVDHNDNFVCSRSEIDVTSLFSMRVNEIIYEIPEAFISVPIEDVDIPWDEFSQD